MNTLVEKQRRQIYLTIGKFGLKNPLGLSLTLYPMDLLLHLLQKCEGHCTQSYNSISSWHFYVMTDISGKKVRKYII